MSFLKPVKNWMAALASHIIPRGNTTVLSDRLPLALSGIPVLDLRKFDDTLKPVLAVPVTYDPSLEKWIMDKNSTRSNKANYYSTALVANTWTLVAPANKNRVSIWVTSSGDTTDFSVSLFPTGLGNMDFYALDQFYTDKYTGAVYMKTGVTHAAEVTEVVI